VTLIVKALYQIINGPILEHFNRVLKMKVFESLIGKTLSQLYRSLNKQKPGTAKFKEIADEIARQEKKSVKSSQQADLDAMKFLQLKKKFPDIEPKAIEMFIKNPKFKDLSPEEIAQALDDYVKISSDVLRKR